MGTRVVENIEKAPWYVRLAGKIVCRHMANTGIKSWQCYGEKNWDYAGKGVDVQVPTEDIISCIIGITGDGISPANARNKYCIDTTEQPSDSGSRIVTELSVYGKDCKDGSCEN